MNKIDEGEQIAWQLFQGSNGEYIFSVLCGTFGMYERKIILYENEYRNYQIHGRKLLEDLAYKLSKNEAEFSTRFLS